MILCGAGSLHGYVSRPTALSLSSQVIRMVSIKLKSQNYMSWVGRDNNLDSTAWLRNGSILT